MFHLLVYFMHLQRIRFTLPFFRVWTEDERKKNPLYFSMYSIDGSVDAFFLIHFSRPVNSEINSPVTRVFFQLFFVAA